MSLFSLEPRLLEYLNRKKFFKQNSIDSTTLEKEYQITRKDKEVINAYLSKNKSLQKDLTKEMHCDFIKPNSPTKPPTSQELMSSDPRFARLRNKLMKEKEARNTKEDISNLSRTYDLFAGTAYSSMGGDFALQSMREDNDNNLDFDRLFSQTNSTTQDRINVNSREEITSKNSKQNKYFIDNNIDPLLRKHKTPSIHYNQVAYNNQYNSYTPHRPTLDNISDKIDNYKKKINTSIDDFNSDKYYNNNVLNQNPCKKDQIMDMYKYVPEMTQGELKDVNIENYVKYGMPTSKAKSIGFENPVEHYFQYIDNDIQDPDHVCFSRPQLSRLSNRQSVRYKNN